MPHLRWKPRQNRDPQPISRRAQHRLVGARFALMVVRTLLTSTLGWIVLAQAVESPLQEAVTLFNSGEYQKSYRLLRAYVSENPRSADAHKVLGMAEFMLGKPDEALSSVQRAIELNPKDVDSYYYLGRLYFTRNNPVEALSAFRKSLELQPANVKALNQLGQTYEALGQFVEAEKSYRDAISADQQQAKKSEWPLYNLGLLYMNQGKIEQATALFRNALQQNPDFAEAKIKLGVALTKSGQIKEGLDLLRQAVQIAPDNPEGHYRLGLLFAKTGNREEAERHLQRFTELTKR